MPYIPRVGAEIAGYRLESVLQRGGMSIVYAAEHMRMKRRVALKILATELADDDRFRERFLNESRMAASIDHPNIIPIYDAGEDNGVLYIAMHYVAGSDLKALLAREAPLEVDRCVSIISQVGGALDAAHRHGLIHRDIKPGNILVVRRPEDDSPDHIYLSDFGLTKHNESHSALTPTGQFLGTVDYVAPEQIEGKAVDARADIYSLGCVFYECLTGVAPFVRDDDLATLWAHIQLEAPRVTQQRPDVPVAFDEVIATALAKSPDDRYGGCRAFVSAVRTAVTMPPVELGGDPTRPAQDLASAPASATPQPDPSPGGEQPSQVTRPPVEQPSQVTQPPVEQPSQVTRPPVEQPSQPTQPPSAGDEAGAAIPAAAPTGDSLSPAGAVPAAVAFDAQDDPHSAPPRDGWLRRHRVPAIALIVLVACAVPLAVILIGNSSDTSSKEGQRPTQPAGESVTGDLAPVPTNHVNGAGNVVMRLSGNVATVTITTSRLLDGSPHPLHIHAGKQGICPPSTAARPHNGHLAISTLDGVPYYGPPVTALTTTGSTSVKSILALNRFPRNGNIRYTRRIALTGPVASYVRADNAVIVVHGADYNGNGVYDNSLDRSDLKRSLPGELTTPALCGKLVPKKSTPGSSGQTKTAQTHDATRVYYASLGETDPGNGTAGDDVLNAPLWICHLGGTADDANGAAAPA
jgi:serine/threonine protein kinase